MSETAPTPEAGAERRTNPRTLIALALLLAGLVFVLARGVAREAVVIPLLYLLLYAQYLFESVPQLIIWLLLVAAALVLAGRSLIDAPGLLRGPRSERVVYGRVETWVRLLTFAQSDDYSRWRLAQRLALLTGELLAHQGGIDQRQARQIIESDAADIPPEVRAYLRAGMAGHRPRPGRLRSLRAAPHPLDLDPARVVEYLERHAK